MAVNKLCASFRQLILSPQSNIITRCYFSHSSRTQNSVLPSTYFVKNKVYVAYPEIPIKFIPRTLNINFGNPDVTNKNINELPPFKIISSIKEPLTRKPLQEDLPFEDKTFDLPSRTNVVEKLAIHLIRIRKRKMKKHQRKKLRKRMKFVWETVRVRRNIKKEKLFQLSMIEKIKKAEAYDPKTDVIEKLKFLEKERIPKTYRGEILPEKMIKQFLDERKKKLEEKFNKPRLTLD